MRRVQSFVEKQNRRCEARRNSMACGRKARFGFELALRDGPHKIAGVKQTAFWDFEITHMTFLCKHCFDLAKALTGD